MLSWIMFYERRKSMGTIRPRPPIILSQEENEQLNSIANFRSYPTALSVALASFLCTTADSILEKVILLC